tara:strand:- start:24505 stop:25104 length:600 start_codon:yes stop_codon:yes gene_type:complete
MKIDPKWLVIAGLIVFILLSRTCNNKLLSGPKIIDEVTTVHTDTLRITHIDTLQFIDTVKRIITVKIEEPVKVIIEDDVWEELDINEYTNAFKDSLIDGTIYTRVNGKMLDQNFNYIPKFPQYIIQIDTVMVNTLTSTTTTVQSRFNLNVGAEVGGNTEKFNFSPLIGFTSNNGISYSYRYGIMDKTHNVGIMYNFKIK